MQGVVGFSKYIVYLHRCEHLCTLSHSVHRCSQFIFSSALFDTDEQCSGILHIMHKKTCGWVDNGKNNNLKTGYLIY